MSPPWQYERLNKFNLLLWLQSRSHQASRVVFTLLRRDFSNSFGAELDAQISDGVARPHRGKIDIFIRRNGSVTIQSCFFDPTSLRPIKCDFRGLIFIPLRDINVLVLFKRLSIPVNDSLINTKSSTKTIIEIGKAFRLLYPRRGSN